MADPLSPEQRAEALFGKHRSPLLGNLVADIAAAIRADETAAVEAERARCANAAKAISAEIDADKNAKPDLWNAGRKAADTIVAAILTTEAAHDR